ncbi:hypothetical protein M2145_002930 [Lachnospiraceae bacterium PF1-21]
MEMFAFISVIAFVGLIYFALFSEGIVAEIQYRNWKKKIEGVHNYDSYIIRKSLNNIAQQSFALYGDKLPYGRMKWFLTCNLEPAKGEIDDNIEFFGFSPIRSEEELEFREYGVLLTQDGIYASYQDTDGEKKKKKYIAKSEYFPFLGLWKVKNVPEQGVIKLYYVRNKIRTLKYEGNNHQSHNFERTLTEFIATGYTNDLKTGKYKEKLVAEMDEYEEELRTSSKEALSIGAMAGVYGNVGAHVKEDMLNGIVQNPQGHGFAAEQANNLVDKVKNPFLKVERVGQDNAKNGADRIVGDTKIQTKYLSSAKNSVNKAFETSENGGKYKYQGMQLEVPKDQYNEAINLMEKKIRDGKVPGHTDPRDASKIVRKGSITWQEAKDIAKGGNLTSLKYDALDGVVQTLPVVGISFAIVFAQAKWSGAETREAALMAVKAGTKTLIMGTIVYAGSQQFSKIMTAKIAEQATRKVTAEAVAKNAGMVISIGIIMAPNIFDSLTGRISSQQLFKNTLVAGSGFLAGVGASAGAGALLGSLVPGAGNAVGAVVGATAGVVGGIAGSVGSKKILDRFIEDDRKEMFAQLKEEYIDVVLSVTLSDEEFTKVQEIVFDEALENKLKQMYKVSKDRSSRMFAREVIVESAVEEVIRERKIIVEKELIDAYNVLVNEIILV